MDTTPRIVGIYEFGQYRLDPVRRTLTRADALVDLTPRLFDTLLYLLENRTRVVERDELERAVWGRRHVDSGNLAMAISSLRKVLQSDTAGQKLIATIPGRGYQFAADVTYEPRLKAPPQFGTPKQAGADPAVAKAAWWRRRPVVHVAALVGFVLLTGGVVATWFASTRIQPHAFVPPPRSIAVLAWKTACKTFQIPGVNSVQ